jgi:hypothetical protein
MIFAIESEYWMFRKFGGIKIAARIALSFALVIPIAMWAR